MKSNMHRPSKSWNTYGQNEPEDNHGNAKVEPTVTIFPIAKHYYSLQVPLLMHNAKIIMCRYLNNRCIT